jgi:hypothetical protein
MALRWSSIRLVTERATRLLQLSWDEYMGGRMMHWRWRPIFGEQKFLQGVQIDSLIWLGPCCHPFLSSLAHLGTPNPIRRDHSNWLIIHNLRQASLSF